MQHTFLLQVREADNESVHPVPCEICRELALQTMYALSEANLPEDRDRYVARCHLCSKAIEQVVDCQLMKNLDLCVHLGRSREQDNTSAGSKPCIWLG